MGKKRIRRKYLTKTGQLIKWKIKEIEWRKKKFKKEEQSIDEKSKSENG